MGCLAAIGLGDGFDVLGPLPSGQERRPTDRSEVAVDQLQCRSSCLQAEGYAEPMEEAAQQAETALRFELIQKVFQERATGQ